MFQVSGILRSKKWKKILDESVTIIKKTFGGWIYSTLGEYGRFSLLFYLWSTLPPRCDDQRRRLLSTMLW